MEAEALHSGCHEQLTAAPERTFHRPSQRMGVNPDFRVTSTTTCEDDVRKRLALVNGCIGCLKQGLLAQTAGRDSAISSLLADLDIEPGTDEVINGEGTLAALNGERKILNSSLRSEQRKPSGVKSHGTERSEWKKAIQGGPIKRLLEDPTITNPPFLLPRESGDTLLIGNPEDKLQIWHAHYSQALSFSQPALAPKPWMTSAGAESAKQLREGGNAFQWPKAMTLADLKQLLGKGNQGLSPGPDSWEKWILRHCNDDFLSKICLLCPTQVGGQRGVSPADLVQLLVGADACAKVTG